MNGFGLRRNSFGITGLVIPDSDPASEVVSSLDLCFFVPCPWVAQPPFGEPGVVVCFAFSEGAGGGTNEF